MSEKDNNENEDEQKLQDEKNPQVEKGLAQNPTSATSALGALTQNKKLKKVLAGLIILLFVGISLVYFFFIKGTVPTVKQNDIKQINLEDYFPTDTSLHLTYYTYGNYPTVFTVQNQIVEQRTDGKYFITEQVSSPPNTPDKKLTPYLNGTLYDLSPNSIKRVEFFGGLINSHYTNIEIILSDKPQWQNEKGVTEQITGLNKQISTPAGTFENCIEVTKIISFENMTVISYFAPKIGLIQVNNKFKNTDSRVFEQLVKYSSSSTNTNTGDNRQKADVGLPKEETTSSTPAPWTEAEGKLSIKSYDNYKGEIIDGKANGMGTYTLPSGDKYVGEFIDGKRNGQGTQTIIDGLKYVGGYKDGKKVGQGTYTWQNGKKFVGEIVVNKDGSVSSQGTMTFPDGTKQSGTWIDDVYQGK